MGWLTDFTEHRRRKHLWGMANTYMEFGLDGAVDCTNGTYIGLQAKHRAIVDGNDTSTFQTVVKVMRDHCESNRGLLYYSNRVTPAVEYSSRVFGFGLQHLPYAYNIMPVPPVMQFALRPYQHDAVEAIMGWYDMPLPSNATRHGQDRDYPDSDWSHKRP